MQCGLLSNRAYFFSSELCVHAHWNAFAGEVFSVVEQLM